MAGICTAIVRWRIRTVATIVFGAWTLRCSIGAGRGSVWIDSRGRNGLMSGGGNRVSGLMGRDCCGIGVPMLMGGSNMLRRRDVCVGGGSRLSWCWV